MLSNMARNSRRLASGSKDPVHFRAAMPGSVDG